MDNIEKGYVDNDPSLKKFMNDAYKDNSSAWLQYMYEADIDSRMESGDQEAMYTYMSSTYGYTKRNQINFNKIHSKVAMVAGHQSRMRKQSIIIPQEPQDQIPADELSNILQWASSKGDVYNNISKAFTGGLITGINLLSSYLDYSNDPLNGDIKTRIWGYNSFLMDPYWKNLDLSDCNYVWTRKFVTKKEAKRLLPGREDEIDALPTAMSRDGKFPYMPENLNYRQRGFLIYDEFWYKDSREENLLLDRETGETHKWNGNDEQLNLFLSSYPQVVKIKQYVDTVKYAVVVNDRVFVNGPNPNNIDRYPFVPFVCYFRPDIPYFPKRIYGIPRLIRDAQWSYNRRARLNLDYLEAGIQRGVKFIEDALVDPEDAFLQGNGKALAVKAGHSLDEVQEMSPPHIPPSWFQEIELLNKDMFEITAINEELMGSAEDDKAGILSMLRQGAGLTALNPIFDNLDLSQKYVAQIHIEMMQNNWEIGKFRRILGRDPHPLIKSKYFQKFDCAVTNGPITATQQTLEFRQLFEMVQLGMLPNSPEVLEVMLKVAPLQNKKDLLEAMQKAQQQQQEQQQQAMSIEMEKFKAEIENLKAQAIANEGLGVERATRVAENQAMAVEKIEAAKKDQDLADLHKARALKELSEMDLSQIERAIAILAQVQQLQAAEEKPGEKESEQEEIVEESTEVV
jgi:hypothetical protein